VIFLKCVDAVLIRLAVKLSAVVREVRQLAVAAHAVGKVRSDSAMSCRMR
jgi:hypothetical protein